MKQKLTALLAALMLLAALATPAFADVIWEPEGNGFYQSHSGECSYHDRSYLANGEKGYVTVRTAPDSLSEVVNLSNGATFFVSHTWTDGDGVRWGVGYPAGQWGQEGWVRLSDMACIYDYRDFAEEHEAELQAYDGSGDELDRVVLYSYPGGRAGFVLEESQGYMPFAESFQYLYTDENGLRWTFVGYYMGHQDSWVCIDDPLNEHLGTDTLRTVGQGADGTIYPAAEKLPAARTWQVWIVPVVLVLAVAVVTAVIVRRRKTRA